MDYSEIIKKIEPNLQETVNAFKRELQKIRAGRLSPSSIEDIKANCFGQELPLKQLGSISAPSPRNLIVELWDRSYVEGVVGALEGSSLNLGIRVDDNKVYLSNPPLTEDLKKDLIKILNQKKEEFFQSIRRQRDKTWKQIQEEAQKGEISEDGKYKGKNDLEEKVRGFWKEIEEMGERKEKEILS